MLVTVAVVHSVFGPTGMLDGQDEGEPGTVTVTVFGEFGQDDGAPGTVTVTVLGEFGLDPGPPEHDGMVKVVVAVTVVGDPFGGQDEPSGPTGVFDGHWEGTVIVEKTVLGAPPEGQPLPPPLLPPPHEVTVTVPAGEHEVPPLPGETGVTAQEVTVVVDPAGQDDGPPGPLPPAVVVITLVVVTVAGDPVQPFVIPETGVDPPEEPPLVEP